MASILSSIRAALTAHPAPRGILPTIRTLPAVTQPAWRDRIATLVQQRASAPAARGIQAAMQHALRVPPNAPPALKQRVLEIMQARGAAPAPTARNIASTFHRAPARHRARPAPVQHRPAPAPPIPAQPVPMPAAAQVIEAQIEHTPPMGDFDANDAAFHGLAGARGFNDADPDYGDLESDLGLAD